MDTRRVEPSALAESGAAAAFDCLPEAYVIVNAQHEVLLANRRYLEMTGRQLDDIRGHMLHDINQFGDDLQREARRAWLDDALRDLPTGETVWSPLFRYAMPRAGAAASDAPVARYWRIKASLLGSADPVLAGAILIRVSEVTARVVEYEQDQRERAKLRSQAQLRHVLAEEARAQLREHQERFEIALAFSQLGAWELDQATDLIDCTDQCKTNLGLQHTDVLTRARWFGEIVHPDDRVRLREAMDAALAEQAHFEVDFRVGWQSGAERWILTRGVGRYRADGELTAVLGFTLDITGRKHAELETRETAEREKRAREQSDRLAITMDHFVTTVSHELRSPLSAIMSWCDLLQRSQDPAHVARAGSVINRNARQLSHMVDDLLDSGAIVTGKLSVNLRPVDLGALAGIVVEDMRMHAEAKGLSLIADRLSSAVVLADENRMKQIVWNLLSNAVKFSPHGTVEVSVERIGDRVELAVRDTGRGIDATMLERIFERFQQSTADGAGRVAGLGLGLWLVKNLVDLHGGEIIAQSAGPDEGATFRVRLAAYG